MYLVLMFVKATMLLVQKMKRIQGGMQQKKYKTTSQLSEVTPWIKLMVYVLISVATLFVYRRSRIKKAYLQKYRFFF